MRTRKVSGCVVYRVVDGELQFLIVKSNSGKNWVFPKGGVEPDLTSRDSAAKEVYEEAGVSGDVGRKLGSYQFWKNDRVQDVTMYAMRYTQDTIDWPEAHLRKRRWVNLEKCLSKVDQYQAVFAMAVVEMLEPNE